MNYIFLVTYYFYHLYNTLISSVFLRIIEYCISYFYSIHSISKRKTDSKPSFGNSSAIVDFCDKILSAKQNKTLNVFFLQVPILEQTKNITLEQRRTDRSKNGRQQTVNLLFRKSRNRRLTMKTEPYLYNQITPRLLPLASILINERLI